MQRRDKICLEKIIKEIDIGTEMVGETTLEEFLDNEMMKRAVGMTVKKDFVTLRQLLENILQETEREDKDE
jgi:hypothetical protein